MEEYLQQATVDAHDKYQLEFKLDYALIDDQATHYKIVTYFFFPTTLGINRHTYPSSHFYRDLQNYVRLKTPAFSLQEILSASDSPLVRVVDLLGQHDWVRLPNITDRLITNLKFLRAILKGALDEAAENVEARLQTDPESAHATARLQRRIRNLVQETVAILATYRNLGPRLNERNVDARVLRSYTLTDEALSVVVGDALLGLLMGLQKVQLTDTLPGSAEELRAAIVQERHYRYSHYPRSILKPDADAGEYLFRVSVLKKFTSSVLYLATSIRREGSTTEQILYALAAGISMIFATVIAFYFQQRYGNFTFPFFVALVVGYMFKDRLKDFMKALSNRLLRSAFYDRRTRIRTLDGEHELGYLRERMAFISERDVPAAVMVARNRQIMTEIDNDGQGETVIRYEKSVTLRKDAVKNLYTEAPPIHAVKDIMRLDVRDYLRKMDDPTKTQLFLKGKKVRRARLPRVYFLNVVQVYFVAKGNEPVNRSRSRIRISRKGIRRLEQFD